MWFSVFYVFLRVFIKVKKETCFYVFFICKLMFLTCMVQSGRTGLSWNELKWNETCSTKLSFQFVLFLPLLNTPLEVFL